MTPQQATKLNDGKDTIQSNMQPSTTTRPTPPRGTSAQKQRQSPPKHPCNETTPNLLLPEDVAIGNGHRSIAISVSAKQLQSGNTRTKTTYLDLVSGPFFIEAFSGTGRMAAGVREHGLDAFEFDLTQQGGKRNLLHANVLHELRSLIAHPMCRGVWFGFPCGTFSSARRNDGGPGPLRGTNPKDTWGFATLGGQRAGTRQLGQ